MIGTAGLVLRRFPAFKDLILSQMTANPRFRSLCVDYKEASDALAEWERTDKPQAAAYFKDYRRLVAELERDIIEELLEHDT